MEDLSLTGKCISGVDTVKFFEMLLKQIPDNSKNRELRSTYEAALNRVRFEVAKGIGKRPKIVKAKYRAYGELRNCGKCGFGLDIQSNYCKNCGTAVLWKNPRCLDQGE
ncbi:MAG: hypothetical protein MR998_12230 [Lachnospiraceae bacterium]|nr:hypothetical protein [Lachnospiraceae bacterium]